MTTLYGKTTLAPLCALALGLAACGPQPTKRHLTTELGGLERWSGAEAPDEAVDAFVSAWNEGERPGVLRLFVDDRRPVIASAPELDDRLRAWRAVSAEVPRQCNVRGAYFKTAAVMFEDRRSGAPIEEIVWLHLKSGRWWMYSL